jgi:hypothetical protein
MSGVSVENSRRAFKQTLKYFLVAVVLCVLSLPYTFLARCISRLASLHSSVNHGASVFPHLFGFFGVDILISLTTPASTASYNMNYSTAAALSSLLLSVLFTSLEIFCINFFELVYSVHNYADFA